MVHENRRLPSGPCLDAVSSACRINRIFETAKKRDGFQRTKLNGGEKTHEASSVII